MNPPLQILSSIFDGLTERALRGSKTNTKACFIAYICHINEIILILDSILLRFFISIVQLS